MGRKRFVSSPSTSQHAAAATTTSLSVSYTFLSLLLLHKAGSCTKRTITEHADAIVQQWKVQ